MGMSRDVARSFKNGRVLLDVRAGLCGLARVQGGMTVEIVRESPDWDGIDLEGLAASAERAALAVLGREPEAFEVALLACDDARISVLNADFRGKPQPTNVLSWPSAERAAAEPGGLPAPPDPGELGDIALAYGVCAQEAEARKIALEHHLMHLIVHGIYHLLGYDHDTEADAALMEGYEIAALATLGVNNPY